MIIVIVVNLIFVIFWIIFPSAEILVGDIYIHLALFLGPSLIYIVLYLFIRSHYLQLIETNKNLISLIENEQINNAVFQTLMFFLAIIQYIFIRQVNFILRFNKSFNDNEFLRSLATVLYFISEIIMMISLCHSINKALNTLKQQQDMVKSMYLTKSKIGNHDDDISSLF